LCEKSDPLQHARVVGGRNRSHVAGKTTCKNCRGKIARSFPREKRERSREKGGRRNVLQECTDARQHRTVVNAQRASWGKSMSVAATAAKRTVRQVKKENESQKKGRGVDDPFRIPTFVSIVRDRVGKGKTGTPREKKHGIYTKFGHRDANSVRGGKEESKAQKNAYRRSLLGGWEGAEKEPKWDQNTGSGTWFSAALAGSISNSDPKKKETKGAEKRGTRQP